MRGAINAGLMVDIRDPVEDKEGLENGEDDCSQESSKSTVGQRKLIAENRFGTVDEVAQVALMLATNEYMTGSTVVIDGGLIYE